MFLFHSQIPPICDIWIIIIQYSQEFLLPAQLSALNFGFNRKVYIICWTVILHKLHLRIVFCNLSYKDLCLPSASRICLCILPEYTYCHRPWNICQQSRRLLRIRKAGNLLLAAHSEGVEGCWYSCYPFDYKVENVKRVLELPEHIIPMCVISVGYPIERKEDISNQKYEPEKIHYEKW